MSEALTRLINSREALAQASGFTALEAAKEWAAAATDCIILLSEKKEGEKRHD